MLELEKAVRLIVDVFDKYACSDKTGKKSTLTKSEMKNLMENELPMSLQGGKGKSNYDKLINDLDKNGDSEVDFQEFLILISTVIRHEKFQTRIQK